jgi:hypothetical protein
LRCAPAIRKRLADDREARKNQHNGDADMRQRQDCPIGDAGGEAAFLSEVIGEQHGLAVPRHQRVHHAEHHGSPSPR